MKFPIELPRLPTLGELKGKFKREVPAGKPDETTDLARKLKGDDRVGTATQWLTTAGGAVAGGVSASVLASTAFVVVGPFTVLTIAAPAIVVAGGVALGGLGAFALGRALHGAGKADSVRARLRKALSERSKGPIELKDPIDVDAETAQVLALIQKQVEQGLLMVDMAQRLQFLLGAGKLTPSAVQAKLLALQPSTQQVPKPG